MTRVLVMMHYAPPHLGGMEEVVAQQSASLAAKGNEVTLLTLAHERGLPRREQSEAGYRIRRCAAINTVERRFGVTFPVPSPLFVWAALREVRRADVVHVHDVFYLTSHIVATLARLCEKPLYLTQHVALVEHPSRVVMAVQRLIYRTIGARIVHQARGIVVYNTNVRDHLLDMGAAPGQITLNHNGIDTDYFSPADPEEKRKLRAEYGLPLDKPVVSFIGRLVPKKGFDLVAGSAAPDRTTIIAGVGALPAGASSARDVVWFGPANRRQVRDLYRMSDVFVFPTVGEIFTLVMQEAMACGVPVVTTNDPAYGHYDLPADTAAFVERNQASVTAAVNALLASPARLAAMAERSRDIALQRFSWRANYDNEYAAYQKPPPVVYVTPYYPPALGGVERVAERIAEGLAGGRQVTVLTSAVGASTGSTGSEGASVQRLRTVVAAKVPIMPALPIRLLRASRHAVVHVHIAQAFVPETVWLTCLVGRRPYVAHFHLDIEPSGPFGPVFVAYKRLVLPRVLRGAARVVALTDDQATFLAQHYRVSPARIAVVPNGVDDVFSSPEPKRRAVGQPLRLLFVGRLSPQKNVTRLLQAMSLVTAPVELMIVGDGEEAEQLRRQLADLKLPRVSMAGPARGDELLAWYRWAEALVVTSDREGMPLVILEAMAAGLPIIGTDVPGVHDTLSSDGLIVEATPAGVAAGIERLASDDDLFDELAHRSHARGLTHRWEHVLASYDQLYADIAR